MSAVLQIQCWLCGCRYERENPGFGDRHNLGGYIEGRYLTLIGEVHDKKGRLLKRNPGDFCDKCGSLLFAPDNGQLAPVLGWAAVNTNPTEQEIRQWHLAIAPYRKQELPARETFDFGAAFKIIGDKLDLILARNATPREVTP